MNKLKLKDFLDLYNFREYRTDIPVEIDYKRNDTDIIRIYLDTSISTNRYIEFGIYDWSEDEYKESIYNSFLNKDILDANIESINFDYDLDVLMIWLGDSNGN